MRIVLALLLLLAQPVFAAECLRIADSPSPPQVVLRGVIELKPASPPAGANEVSLKLSTPICVQGVASDGLPFKKENVEAMTLGLPASLVGTFHPLERVTLRGELWNPDDKGEPHVVFVVREVL